MVAKLHLNLAGKPACGRQLNNHRDTRSQLADLVVLAPSLQAFSTALANGKACRHCAREIGLIPRVTRQVDNQDEVEEKLAEELEDEESEL